MNVELRDALREAFVPEAEEYLISLSEIKIKTTQDNYGNVMAFLTKLPSKEAQAGFLGALVDAGYPADTGDQLASIMGVSL